MPITDNMCQSAIQCYIVCNTRRETEQNRVKEGRNEGILDREEGFDRLDQRKGNECVADKRVVFVALRGKIETGGEDQVAVITKIAMS